MNDNKRGELQYTCPGCSAPLIFDPKRGRLRCEFCGSDYSPEEMEEKNRSREAEKAVVPDGEEWKAYSCSSCGAELLADQNTAVMTCPYCGNHTIVTAQFAGAIRPDSLIPFGVTKEDAVAQYEAYYKKGIRKFLLPASFGTDSHIQEIQGVYIPFWLFNGKARIDGIYDTSNERQEGDYKIVEHYQAERSGEMSFDKVPADASRRMADDLMDSIEPYDFRALKPFAMTYLPGFLAERFDVDEEDDKERAKKRIRETICAKTEQTVHYDRIDKRDHVKVDVHFDKTSYALLPAWLLTTRWQDREWTFAMNAQTGKFTGNLPIQGGKLAFSVLLAFLVPFLPLYFAAGLSIALLIGCVTALITGLVLHGEMKPVSRAGNADHYMEDQVHLDKKTDRFVNREKIHNPQSKNQDE